MWAVIHHWPEEEGWGDPSIMPRFFHTKEEAEATAKRWEWGGLDGHHYTVAVLPPSALEEALS